MAKFPLYALSGYNNGVRNFYKLFVAGKAMGINMAIGRPKKMMNMYIFDILKRNIDNNHAITQKGIQHSGITTCQVTVVFASQISTLKT